jgi:hypothetical protein
MSASVDSFTHLGRFDGGQARGKAYRARCGPDANLDARCVRGYCGGSRNYLVGGRTMRLAMRILGILALVFALTGCTGDRLRQSSDEQWQTVVAI